MEFREAKELATALTNVKTKKRLEPAHVTAERLERLYRFYKSWDILGEKLDVSREMLREFAATKKLPEGVKRLLEANNIFNVDIAYRITKLRDDQDKLGLTKALIENDLTSSDVRDIIAYRTANPEISMEKATQRVLESKNKTVTHHIIIMELSEAAFEALKKKAEKKEETSESLVLKLLARKWSKEQLLSVTMRGSDLIIKVSEGTYEGLRRRAENSNVKLKDLADFELQKMLVTTE